MRDNKTAKHEIDASAPQRWLILTQYYPPEIGAPQIRLRCLVRELRRRGKQVSVLTAMPNYPAGRIFDGYRGRFSSREQIDGVDVRRTWVYAATGRAAAARFLNYCSFALTALAVLLFARRPDVMFVEAQPLPLGVVALFMKYVRGVPYVYNVPDLQVDVARELGFLRKRFLLRLAEGAENLFLKNAWKVSTVTHHFIKHFESRGVPADRITFLPNGADTDFLQPREPSSEYLHDWQLQGKKAFVYVGTHAYYHGLDTLIEAAEILKTDPEIKIVMIGDGPERERIRGLAREKGLDNVEFARVPYERTDELYSVAYAALATLRNVPVAKGMRLSKIFPALSCGVPVIYSGEGEAADLIVLNRCGFTPPPEDAAALAQAMRFLARNPALRQQLGTNGRRLVKTEYSWTTIVERWLCEIARQEASITGAVPHAKATYASAPQVELGSPHPPPS
jgi:glycosyltransferase involved in cell wall biosynthesis